MLSIDQIISRFRQSQQGSRSAVGLNTAQPQCIMDRSLHRQHNILEFERIDTSNNCHNVPPHAPNMPAIAVRIGKNRRSEDKKIIMATIDMIAQAVGTPRMANSLGGVLAIAVVF